MNSNFSLSGPISLPDLIINHHRQLTKIVYNQSENLYQLSESIALPYHENCPESNIKVLSLNTSIFVSIQAENHYSDEIYEGTILKLTNTLQEITRKQFSQGIASFATDGETLFISTEGKLVSLTQDLETLDEVGLELNNYGRKNAHDILTYQNTAYLLDNIVYPIFILRADITDPRNLKITATISIKTTYPHLERQWLNPALNQWCIIERYGNRSGSGKTILIYPLQEGNTPIGQQHLCHDNSGFINAKGHRGIDIITITEQPPIWAIIRDESQRIWLASVNTEDNVVSFNKKITLNTNTNNENQYFKQAKIKYQNTNLFIFYPLDWEQIRILVLNVEIPENPNIILNQTLSNIKNFKGVELLTNLNTLETKQPRPDEAVLGGQSSQLLKAAVLGGIEGVKRGLASRSSQVRIAALSEALKLGEEGIKLVEEIIKSETGSVQGAAYDLLWKSINESQKNELIKYLPLDSAVDIDYTSLRDLLAAKDWQQANLLTSLTIDDIIGSKPEAGYGLGEFYFSFFPCEDLRTIDQLWVKLSNGHFGFSVQKRIYDSLLQKPTYKYDSKIWQAFGGRVGWHVKRNWLTLSELSFTTNSPQGHLPVLWGQGEVKAEHYQYTLNVLCPRIASCRIP